MKLFSEPAINLFVLFGLLLLKKRYLSDTMGTTSRRRDVFAMAEQPKYLLVADTLRQEIADGIFRDGQTLMTEEELRIRFDVSRQTVRQAISLLEADGLVDRRRGSGTYVRHGPRRRQGIVHVGVITTFITDYIFPSIAQGMESVLNEGGAVMSLSAMYNDPQTERNILERMLDEPVDGLIMEGSRTAMASPNGDVLARFAQRNIPVLFVNGYHPGMEHIPHVVMDDYGGGRLAGKTVLDKGYTRPAGFFKTDDLQGKERLNGFLDEMHSRGIDVPENRLLCFSTEERNDLYDSPRARELMEVLKNREADCLVCYNDIFAMQMMAKLQKEGLKIPEELGMIGFDDATFSGMLHPALTTLGHQKEVFGALAARKILRMIAGEKEDSVTMNWTLIERESLPVRTR